jgi:hypothetical protein
MNMRPIEALAALESHLRTLRRTNAARLMAAPEQVAESLDRFILLQCAIEAVQRAARDEQTVEPSSAGAMDRSAA